MIKLDWSIRACGVLLFWAAGAVITSAQTDATGAAPTFTTVSSFDYTDGFVPIWGLAQGTNGDLYGTTFGGGCGVQSQGEGCGTVFKITPGGKLTSLYTFCSQGGNACTDGIFPTAGLVQGADGKFYGTTPLGGSGYGNNGGTVFSITANGKLTTLYSFCSQGGQYCTDGDQPPAAPVQGADGNFYGTTTGGGANDWGTVFKITPGGKVTTLYSFCSQGGQCPDGLSPAAGLVLGSDGKFYGTTYGGGANGNAGTVFSITASGALTTLYSFDDSCADGCSPRGGLGAGYGRELLWDDLPWQRGLQNHP
jgi:uncharacterized repeat protein (TIGR03803 family)